MPLVSVFISSPDAQGERRFDPFITIEALKEKLHPVTGISPQYQILRLYPSLESSPVLATFDDEKKSLEEYGVKDGNCIRVENTDPSARPGEYSDLTGVDKFELTHEEYEARSDTVLAHLKANKLGRFAPTPTNLSQAPPPPTSVPPEIITGKRCEVISSEGDMARRGTVRFVGEASVGRGGVWVGVELDEPVGKGGGSVNGKKYFECRPKHAVFVRPDKVRVGDFPEEDLMGSDEEI
ncbi:hypothetical protein TREMEDRAFT_39175 [Tremella mesenterica DSM 1558]|uniref:uncharacterized protein n=1 Tax=Tremella mesenterica (strain ATCC 24925 / CBS 8224 / DSM 1558 / NBRC 9311 / NRRL Y-6157 / RJB 2259-6 / UBC 559-6) TaxID=578456 RepID=UPI0003F4A19D|nr:uncharacterized protein TREMEDRAFT_39175 [Tremella mesenterica DSM 1558]EIW69633.1 hypothetical protein TREMEDRAFT_39175 [Tremella mesenterica DSM 1558]